MEKKESETGKGYEVKKVFQGKRTVWMIIVILSFLFIGGAVLVGLRLASINSGYSKFYSSQMEICLDGDILYYCDHNREAELYAYNLKTGEEVMVTEQQGAPYKTSHGCFYLVEDDMSTGEVKRVTE